MSILSIHIFNNYTTGDVLYVEIVSHHRGTVATYQGPTLKEAIAEWRKYRYTPDIKYAVAGICDQTHWYMHKDSETLGEDPRLYGTISYASARLFDTLEEARQARDAFDPNGWVEIVSHVEEFQSRMDTW